jgi:hypothetical protein
MNRQRGESESLSELVRKRNQLAYQLATASGDDRRTSWYLAQEELMNHLTNAIDRLRQSDVDRYQDNAASLSHKSGSS